MRYLTFALAKGRLANKSLDLFEKIGITCEEMKDKDTRKLIFTNEELGYRFFLAKANDVPTYVEYGAADIGIVGKDTILEEGRKLYEVLDPQNYEVKSLCGISSVVYFCGKLKTSWEDVCLQSTHGRSANLIGAVKAHEKTFTLLSAHGSVEGLCKELKEYGLTDVTLYIGERLGYPEEKITTGTPEELEQGRYDDLCVALIENSHPFKGIRSCVEDEEFLRGKAPMTKSEIRSLSVAKLHLEKDSVVYDVGAGTGSVTIELALAAADGMVYAVERNQEACDLIEQNKRKFGTPNIEVIHGLAPEAMEDLPAPTHAFIDSEIIAQAPDKYLWAGIGDALSKEIESTFSARGDELDYTDGLGIQIGKMCTERLLQYGTQALKDSAANQPSYAIEQVVLDIIVTTGLVSVLVINDYNSALAHSFYYGTTVLEKMEDYLHGASVSYGVLALLQLDQQEALFQRIYAFMKENKLPVCLADMGLNATSDLEAILDKAMTTNDIVHVPYEITREMFKQAILDVEAYHAKQNQASLAAAN